MNVEMIGLPQGTYWLLAVCISLASCAISVATFRRAGDWRKTEAGKQAHDNILAIDGRVSKLEHQIEGLPAKIGTMNDRLRDVEQQLRHMPTKAEIATLSSEMEAVQDDVRLVRGGITRIEDFLLRMSKP